MRRRESLLALAALALGAPLAARAQPAPGSHRIGFLALRSRSTAANPDPLYDAFMQEMRALGYVEGKNLVIEWRFADGMADRLPALASELVRAKVEVIVTHGSPPTRAAQRATSLIPIVTAVMGAPVRSGFAKTLARPGGNVTGLSSINLDLAPKQNELVRTLLPRASRVALLANPDNKVGYEGLVKAHQEATQRVGVTSLLVDARTPDEIRRSYADLARQRADAVIVAADAFFFGQGRLFAELGLAHRLPSMSSYRQHVQAGVLISYGQDVADYYRRAAAYVDRILKGAKPGDLPIEQPTRIHLAINRKTAGALGITVPQELLLRADEVIE
ncbi:MAG: ABC transporter substrate-binding protein [Pseudomonadota bacterium]